MNHKQMDKNQKRPTFKKGTVKRLLKYIGKYKIQWALVVVFIIISSIASAVGALTLKRVIDEGIVPIIGASNPDFTTLLTIIVQMIVIYATGLVTGLLYNRIMVTISQGTQKKIRDDLFNNMQELPIKYFDTHTHGEIMSVYTNDVDTLNEMISRSLPGGFSAIITLVSTFASMVYLNGVMALLVIFFTILTIAVTRRIAKKSSEYFVKRQNSIAKVNGYAEEMINGQKVIKVFNHEDIAKKDFDKINEQLNHDMYKANKYANIMMPVANNMGNIEYVSIAIIGTILALNGAITLSIGTLISFLQLIKMFNQPINQVMNQVSSIIMALAGASRIFDLMDEEPEKDEGYVTLVNVKEVDGKLVECKEKTEKWAWKHPHHDGTLEYVELKGRIDLIDVDFGYEENKTVLHDISLYAKPGQKIAFVGATGAGKTTITNLINRFYDIEDGKIRYDGININKIKKEDLRESLGMVLQDTNLFTGTIKDNIKYGNLEATDEEVIEAAKLANAHGFISRLPDGYDTMLTDNGSQLSQGQRQLIAIARAAINDPPVMILDEATSSIDTRTEKIVQDGMDRLMKGRTVLVIAHRLSTVRNSKAIMVMQNGRIIERGDHDQLLEQKGEYYQLYTGAFELE